MATLTEFLTGIADAIRKKKGTSGPIPAPNFVAEIESIDTGTDTSDATATAGDIVSGKTAYGASGKLTGTITKRTASNLTASGATVSVPAGYYASRASKSVATATQATPSISVSTRGLITASATQGAGYVSAGTKSATKQLTTQAAKIITPGTSSQTAVASGRYTTGAVTVSGDSNLTPENIKSGVDIFGVSGTFEGEDIVQKIMSEGTKVNNTSSSGASFSVSGYNKAHIVVRRSVSFQYSSDDYWYSSIILVDDGDSHDKTYGLLLATTTASLGTNWRDSKQWVALNIRHMNQRIYIDVNDGDGTTGSLSDIDADVWYMLE